MFMKTSEFEEKFTAWTDGRLSPEETIAFEKTMAERGFDPVAERRAAARLSQVLNGRSAPTPALANPDFFHHQLLHRIAQETPGSASAAAPAPRGAWRTLPRLAWGAAFCLLIATVCFQAFIPHGRDVAAKPERSPYFAQVIDARPLDPRISAETRYTERDNVTVVWLAGMDDLPANFVIR